MLSLLLAGCTWRDPAGAIPVLIRTPAV